MSGLPKWKLRGDVLASVIVDTQRDDLALNGEVALVLEHGVRRVGSGWFDAYKPVIGGYYVEYPAHMPRYMTAATFEKSHERVVDVPSPESGKEETSPEDLKQELTRLLRRFKGTGPTRVELLKQLIAATADCVVEFLDDAQGAR